MYLESLNFSVFDQSEPTFQNCKRENLNADWLLQYLRLIAESCRPFPLLKDIFGTRDVIFKISNAACGSS